MKIAIPTTQRTNCQHTVRQLLRGNVHKEYECTLVIPRSEFEAYCINLPNEFRCLPIDCSGINNVRQYIIEHFEDDKILMLDDDLNFYYRLRLREVGLNIATDEQVLKAIRWIDEKLDSYAHCSISARTQNFQTTSRLLRSGDEFALEIVRPWRTYGFRRDIILGEDLDFHADLDINTMDDFHMTLSLLELGYPNIVNFRYAHEQRGSNSKGGASTYRDLDLLKRCALNLKAKHPEGLVETVERKTINSWGGTTDKPVYRTDVKIYWQKALGVRANESKL